MYPPDPVGEFTSLPRSPGWVKRGLLLKGGREGRGREWGGAREGEVNGMGKGGEWKGREGGDTPGFYQTWIDAYVEMHIKYVQKKGPIDQNVFSSICYKTQTILINFLHHFLN